MVRERALVGRQCCIVRPAYLNDAGWIFAPPSLRFPARLTALSDRNNNCFEVLAVFLRSNFSLASLPRRKKAHFHKPHFSFPCPTAR